MNVFEVLRDRGFATVPCEFYSLIDEWGEWYKGNVKTFHTYRVFNGQKSVKCKRYTMNMGKKVSEDWANLLVNEKVVITLEGKKEQEFFDRVCRENNFYIKANEMQELKAALGTVAFVPRASGVGVAVDTGDVVPGIGNVKIDYVTAGSIIPLSWENGIVKECAFVGHKVNGKDKFLYLQIHRIDEGGLYVIENLAFYNNNGNMSPATLEEAGMHDIPPVVNTGSAKRQFVIDRMNIANNVDVSLPMGVAVFANAIDQLKGVDVAYDSYVNEFILGKKRIMVKPEATKSLDGDPFFDENDLTFYLLPEDAQGGDVIKEIDMKLRTSEHNVGIQDALNALSSKCGFGENHYRFDRGSVATATQIISENSTMFRTIKKHEIILEDVLKELCRIILRLGNIVEGGLNEDVEISIDFDDSIIEDKETEFNRDSRMVSMGIMNAWEFRAKWMNEDEKTAKAALPQMETLVSDGA